ncbi:hypothetical protein BLS_003560 [Venturia inaequalis]|uniref:mRNA 3'-end-processing protein n=1 Tax=Venturia inaequalis TaxID=5025 RepID=A0A8H3UPU0_VENIN|nr:hypothetical protein BLS_003560 [Venturia inaequalis]
MAVVDAPQYKFSFDEFLKREYRFGIAPDQPTCKAFLAGHCPLGNSCPDKHPARTTQYNNLICKHFLRGLCKKGENCEFLHSFNLRKMPECNYWQRHQTCPAGDDCAYQHTDPSFKRPTCPHYERGFCPLGPVCANRHIRKERLCKYYLAGFCPSGRGCQEGAHPRFPTDLRKPEVLTQKTPEELEREKEERERQVREEEDREREREERMGPGQGSGGAENEQQYCVDGKPKIFLSGGLIHPVDDLSSTKD